MSGTPLENDLDELAAIFAFVEPGLVQAPTAAEVREAGGPLAAAAELRLRGEPLLLRRTKARVLQELPTHETRVLRCALSEEERRRYDEVRVAARVVLSEEGKGARVLEALLRLRQLCCHPKLARLPAPAEGSAKLRLLLGVLERAIEQGHRTLVFSQWTSLLDLVAEALGQRGWRWMELSGRTPAAARADWVARWQADDGPPIALISIQVGGAGLNLTAADHVVFLEPAWNPATEKQAVARAHRIGQHRPVFIHKLLVEDSVEERIIALQQHKKELFAEVMGDGPEAEAQIAAGLQKADLATLFSDEPPSPPE